MVVKHKFSIPHYKRDIRGVIVGEGVTEVEVEVNLGSIARFLSTKLRTSKSGKSVYMGGRIKAKMLSTRMCWEEPTS